MVHNHHIELLEILDPIVNANLNSQPELNVVIENF